MKLRERAKAALFDWGNTIERMAVDNALGPLLDEAERERDEARELVRTLAPLIRRGMAPAGSQSQEEIEREIAEAKLREWGMG